MRSLSAAGRNSEPILVSQMIEQSESSQDVLKEGKAFYCQLVCYLTWIHIPADAMSRPMFYLACQVCKRKVFQMVDQYRCENCDKFYEDVVPTYNFRITISDCSGSIDVGCFGEVGEAILGMSGAEFFNNYHEDLPKIKDLRQSLLFKQIAITCRGKLDQYIQNERPQAIKYQVIKVNEFDL